MKCEGVFLHGYESTHMHRQISQAASGSPVSKTSVIFKFPELRQSLGKG